LTVLISPEERETEEGARMVDGFSFTGREGTTARREREDRESGEGDYG
jgi:hypothetical protein